MNRTRFAILILTALLLGGIVGCTAQQEQQAQTLTTQAQGLAAAAQSAVTADQAVLTAATQAAATQPANATEATAVTNAQSALTTAQTVLQQAQTALQNVQQVETAIQNGTTPNFSFLSTFGPYGTIAGLALGLIWTGAKAFQNSQALAAVQPLLAHLQTITGTTTPTAAVVVAHNAVTGTSPVAAAAS